MDEMASKGRRIGCAVVRAVVLVLLAAVVYVGWRFGPVLLDFWNQGFFSSTEQRTYEGTSTQNLKALYTALRLYHDSEGQFPLASGWMDAAKDRVKAADMTPEEAMKKFVNPALGAGREGVYGYAMNDAVSGKYKDDIRDPGRTPLLFESTDTSWNAHGDPKRLTPKNRGRGSLAIMVDGTVQVIR
jgi:hypothetical protein